MALGTVRFAVLFVTGALAGAAGFAAVDGGDAAKPRTADLGTADHSEGESSAAPPAGLPDLLSPRSFDASVEPNLTHVPPFDLEEGDRPTLAEAKEFAKKYSRFIAKGNQGIDKLRAEGHLTGAGTREDPYVLERFYVEGELSFTSLGRALILRDGYVGGQLKLNYVGEQVYVHHVYAKDLRVNENIKRNGTNTGGLFHDNAFAFVGQIRHFVGEFRDNTVGPRPADAVTEYLADAGVAKVDPAVVFNFDGFHMADVHHNTFLGQVDIKLHGHNHGDCFTCPVHDHHDASEFPHDGESADAYGFRSRHSVRYASLMFRDNEIEVPLGVALRYNDRNHAGDDQTASSEPNEHLEDPHVHFQDVTIRGNRLLGGALLFDVFNAPDDRHPVQNRGILRVLGNEVELHYRVASGQPSMVSAVRGQSADGLELRMEGNRVRFVEDGRDDPKNLVLAAGRSVELRGIQWDVVDASNLTLARNVVESGRIGLFASKFTGSVQWSLLANEFRTTEPWRGKDVQNPPREE